MGKKKENTNTEKFKIGDKLNISVVKRLKEEIEQKLSTVPEIELDFKDVKKIDTAGFQLIVFLKKSADKNNKKILFLNLTDEVLNFFNFYNESGVLL